MDTPAELSKHILEGDNLAPAPKKLKTEITGARDVRHGVAPIKPEFIVERRRQDEVADAAPIDDNAAEASRHTEGNTAANAEAGRQKRQRGQNKARKFHFAKDDVRICNSLAKVEREGLFESTVCEFAANAPNESRNRNNRRRGGKGGNGTRSDRELESKENLGEGLQIEPNDDGLENGAATTKKCDFEHNLRTYLTAKKSDIEGICPVWDLRGTCPAGWRCRWLGSHVKEENGELMLTVGEDKTKAYATSMAEAKKRRLETSKVTEPTEQPQEWEKDVPVGCFDDPYGEIVNNIPMHIKISLRKDQFPLKKSKEFQVWLDKNKADREDDNAAYVEPPLRAEEKRKLYIGRETPLLAPLTTTGNLPFRRLCAAFGAAITYSEMAMSTSLLQGHKPEWALMRAHTLELPTFGAQIAANKVGQAMRATEALTTLLPSAASARHGLALVDLNCGCPIDLVYKSGGGSALLDQHSKLSKILKGMNYVSGETPITCKIRMGTRDNQPTAQKLVQRLVYDGDVQAITLHGRSRQQRYTRAADWEYIAQTAALIKSIKEKRGTATDTAHEKEGPEKQDVYFVGNGDCYSHADYFSALDNSGVNSVMVARGALIKPWIFEEIEKGQYLDKSSSQRLDMVRDYCKYGLENWGSDELGIASTRRFLLEFLSFHHRYVPTGILERLPPRLQDRPPLWRGRDEMETLLGSTNYKDWIKISEIFLGPCPADFYFTPKHKSNSYEAEG